MNQLRFAELPFGRPETERSVIHRLRAVIDACPGMTALVSEDGSLSYEELLSGADRLAGHITERGSDDQLIGIITSDSKLVAVAAMGVLAAGKAFVVLDHSQPWEYLRRLIAQAGIQSIVGGGRMEAMSEGLGVSYAWNLDRLGAKSDSMRLEQRGSDLAYVVFTSGSTGAPKGVMHSHENALHHARVAAAGRGVVAGDRIATVARFDSAASLMDLFSTLLSGARLFPYDLAGQPMSELPRWLADNEIAVCRMVPTVFRQLASVMDSNKALPDLRVIGLAGETVLPSDVIAFRDRFVGGCRLQVGYGTSETHRAIQMWIDRDDPVGSSIPVGRAVDDVEINVVDSNGDVLHDAAAVGELVISGRYLALGYWRNAELTAARFDDDPARPSWRRFHSRDKVRRESNGDHVFLSRHSHIAKIGGRSVNRTEVENAIIEMAEVTAASVAAIRTESGGERLIAHVQCDARHGGVTSAEIREKLASRLPMHMIPGTITVHEALPLLASGKVDRQALASAPLSTPRHTSRVPGSKRESRLLQVWKAVLCDQSLGVHDDFFENGGGSLQAMDLLLRVEALCGTKLSLIDLLHCPTVAQMDEVLGGTRVLQSRKPLVVLQKGCDESVLLCIPGFGGSPIAFRNVVGVVGRHRTVYGLDLDACRTVEKEAPVVADIAVETHKALESIHLGGVVQLLGYSFGGLVAFELARQLTEAGRIVDRLIVLDMWTRRFARPKGVRKKLVVHAGNLRRIMRTGDWRHMADGFRRLLRARGRPEGTGVPASNLSATGRVLRAMSRRYAPGYFPGCMDLVLARHSMDESLEFPADYGWHGHVDVLRTHRVQASHWTMLGDQEFDRWSDCLERLLEVDPDAGTNDLCC